jgi:hypothetical protein
VTIGPIRLSTYGLGVLLAVFVWWTWSERRLVSQHIPVPDWLFPVIIAAAWLGGRLGALQYDGVGSVLQQLISVRVFEYAWWSALTSALVVGWISARRLAVATPSFWGALVVPTSVAYGLVTTAAQLGGTALGVATTLPWAIDSLGMLRHPVGWYSAVLVWGGAVWLWRSTLPPVQLLWRAVMIAAANELLTAGFRADSWALPGGLHPEQILGLVVFVVAQERAMMQHHGTE